MELEQAKSEEWLAYICLKGPIFSWVKTGTEKA